MITEKNLYRSIRVEQFPQGAIIESQPAPEILYPDFQERPLPGGKMRKPDTKPMLGSDGNLWVKTGYGTSLFDRQGLFKGKGWLNFTIPHGTEVPDSLQIRHTDFNLKFQSDHYQIEPRARMMLLESYKGALDNLARAALARTVELARTER